MICLYLFFVPRSNCLCAVVCRVVGRVPGFSVTAFERTSSGDLLLPRYETMAEADVCSFSFSFSFFFSLSCFVLFISLCVCLRWCFTPLLVSTCAHTNAQLLQSGQPQQHPQQAALAASIEVARIDLLHAALLAAPHEATAVLDLIRPVFLQPAGNVPFERIRAWLRLAADLLTLLEGHGT